MSPMHHIHWDARSNAVLTVDKDGEPLDLAEEGVDFSDSEGGASQEGADGSGQGQQQQQQGEGRLVRSNSVVSGLASVSSSSSVGSLSRSVGGGGRIKAKDRSNKRGSEHSVGRKENGGSSNNSVASSSHHSAASSTTHRGDTTIGQVNPSIGERYKY